VKTQFEIKLEVKPGIKTVRWDGLSPAEKTEVLKRPVQKSDQSIAEQVARILESVRVGGDEALFQLTAEFDGVKLISFQVSAKEIDEAYRTIKINVLDSLNSLNPSVWKRHQVFDVSGDFCRLRGWVCIFQVERPPYRLLWLCLVFHLG
jgi:hypothetical protein